MMTLNENKIIRYYLGIWDDFSDVSVKDWACRVFRYEIPESEAQDILDMLRPDLLAEYERYLDWMDKKLCMSRVDFDDYYGLRMMEGLENGTDPDVPDFGYQFSDEEFAEFEEKVIRYLEKKGYPARFGEKGFVLGHHLAAFLFYLRYSMDEISSKMVNVLFSRNRLYEEKIFEAVKLKTIKDVLSRAMGDYCYSWETYREGNTSLEFALGYFNNRFYTSGSVIDMCNTKSALSRYSDSLLAHFMARDEKYLTDDIAQMAFELRDEANEKISDFKSKANNLPADTDLLTVEAKDLASYLPYSAERVDELLFSVTDNATLEYYWYFLEIQGMLASIDLMLNIMRSRESVPDGGSFSSDDLDDLYEELEFDRGEIIGLVYTNRRKASKLTMHYSMEQVEAAEKHLLDCWRMMDILQSLVESGSVDDIEQYMRLKKQIVEKASNDEEGTLMQMRLEHIIGLMERKVEELSDPQNTPQSASQSNVEELSGQLEERAGNVRHVSRDFLIPLAGGERLYSLFVKNNAENIEFDYSCIAIMYYTALETLLVQYLYINYLKKTGIMEDGETRSMPIDEARELNRRYFAGAVKLEERFVRERNAEGRWMRRLVEGRIPNHCELGSFKYLFNNRTLRQSEDLRNYVTHDLGIRDTDALINYCERVFSDIREGRNHAAHGMHIVTYEETVKAKRDTYIDEVSTLSGMIIEFLTMINLES